MTYTIDDTLKDMEKAVRDQREIIAELRRINPFWRKEREHLLFLSETADRVFFAGLIKYLIPRNTSEIFVPSRADSIDVMRLCMKELDKGVPFKEALDTAIEKNWSYPEYPRIKRKGRFIVLDE